MRLETRDLETGESARVRSILSDQCPTRIVAASMLQEWELRSRVDYSQSSEFVIAIEPTRSLGSRLRYAPGDYRIRVLHSWPCFARTCLVYDPAITSTLQERLSRFSKTDGGSLYIPNGIMEVFLESTHGQATTWVQGALWTIPEVHIWTNGTILYAVLGTINPQMIRGFQVMRPWQKAESQILCESGLHAWTLSSTGYKSPGLHILESCSLLYEGRPGQQAQILSHPDLFEDRETPIQAPSSESDRIIVRPDGIACPKCGRKMRGEIRYGEPC